jgi:hypothetical protein
VRNRDKMKATSFAVYLRGVSMRKLCLSAGALVLLVTATFAYGRMTDGVLDGVVVNGKGAPVAFAEVFWQTADGKAPHAARTNGKGHFRIAGISQGLYDVRAQALGFTSEWEHNIFVRSGRVASLTLHLTHPTARNGSGNKH